MLAGCRNTVAITGSVWEAVAIGVSVVVTVSVVQVAVSIRVTVGTRQAETYPNSKSGRPKPASAPTATTPAAATKSATETAAMKAAAAETSARRSSSRCKRHSHSREEVGLVAAPVVEVLQGISRRRAGCKLKSPAAGRELLEEGRMVRATAGRGLPGRSDLRTGEEVVLVY